MGILETEAEEAKCKASYITFKWKTGEMTVDFRSYVKVYNYGINSVKRLLRYCPHDVEHCAVMLRTVCILIVETKTEYKQVMDDARRKTLNNRYEKLTKLKNLLEGDN